MKILVLNYEYPPLGGGGGRLCQKLNESYANIGYKIIVITSKTKDLKFITKHENITIYRLPVLRFSRSSAQVYQMLIYLLLALPLSIYLILKNKIVKIHIHFLLPTGVLGLVLKIFFNIKYIITLHGGDVPSHQPELTNKYFIFLKGICRQIIKKSSKTIAVSESLYQTALKDFQFEKAKITYIENGVFPKNTIIKNNSKHANKHINFISIARLSKEKRIFSIMKELIQIKNNYHYDIIGNGEEFLDMDQFLQKKKESRIILHGWISNENIINEFLEKADFILINSQVEGLSMALLEAMSYGVIPISVNCLGINSLIVNNKNGFIFNNKNELKNIFKKIFSDTFIERQIIMRQENQKIINKYYNIKNKAIHYLDYLNNF